MKPAEDAAFRFDHILESLWNKDEKTRETGMKDLEEFQKDVKDPGLDVGLKALRAAARPYPFKNPMAGDVSAQLVSVVTAAPRPEYVPIVIELFDKFSDDAKGRAQVVLTELESREAAEACMTIIRSHAPTGKLPSLSLERLVSKPRHTDVFFPEILKYATNANLASDIYRLCLAYCEADLLRPEGLAPYTAAVVKSYGDVAGKLRPAQMDRGIGWMWDDAYQESRHHAALLIDLLGYFPAEQVEAPLREALDYQDPRLKHFAVISLLRLGKAVDRKHVKDVARHAEMRNWHYGALNRLGQSALFPNQYRTQKAFAEAEMVNWLVYPTELNRAPHEIELMKVISVDTGSSNGTCDYYLFRFRTAEPHWAAKNGWMAGIAGPFAQKDQPTTDALGDTFSTFAKWDAKTPDDHVNEIRALMEKKWREYREKRND
jgi:hypothetical protein